MKIREKIENWYWKKILGTHKDINVYPLTNSLKEDQKRADALKKIMEEHIRLSSKKPYLTLDDFYPKK